MFFKTRGVYISNPFKLHWKKNWTFQIVHMEGGIHIEAKGLETENPYTALGNLREVIRNYTCKGFH